MRNRHRNKRRDKSRQKPRKQQVHTVPLQDDATEQNSDIKPNILDVAEVKPSQERKSKTEYCKPDQTPWWKILLESSTLFVGVIVAVIYGRQLGQMLEANKLAQKTFEVSQQASVTLGRKDGVVAEFRNARNPNVQDGLVLYFQNSGHMPAKLKWGINEWLTESPPTLLPGANKFRPMMRTRNKKTGDISEDWSTDGSIGGDAVREVAVGYLPPGFVDSLSKANKSFKVNGTFEYCDELGRYACRNFSLAYQPRPFGTFRIIGDQACPDRAWLGNTNPRPDEEVLPMCVPRNAPAFPNR